MDEKQDSSIGCMEKDTTRRLVKVIEVSKIYSISKDSVYRLAKQKEIPSHRIGNSLRFDLDEIDEWLSR